MGRTPLSRLAARVGQTSFYAYDRSLLRERVAWLLWLLLFVALSLGEGEQTAAKDA